MSDLKAENPGKRFVVNEFKKNALTIFVFLTLSFVASIIEMMGIGLVFPFIYVLVSPTAIQNFDFVVWVMKLFHIENHKYLNYILLAAIGSVLVLKNIYMLFFHYYQMKVLVRWKCKLSERLLKTYLYSNYEVFLRENPSDIIRNIVLMPVVFDQYIVSIFNIMVGGTLCVSLAILLFMIVSLETVFSIGALVFVIFWMYKKLKITFRKTGKEADDIYQLRQQLLGQALGSIKETKIFGREVHFTKEFMNVESKNFKNTQFYNFLSAIPVLTIETCILCSILVMILFYLSQNMQAKALAILTVLIASLFRILPHINKVLTSLQLMNRSSESLNIIASELEDLEKNIDIAAYEANTKSLSVKECVEFKNVCYQYPCGSKSTVKDISIRIPKNAIVGITGSSGCGKSTFMGLFLGLLNPAEGEILVNNKSIKDALFKRQWQKSIGFVPQDVFIVKGTVIENVAFGVEPDKVDLERVKKCLQLACLDTYIENLPKQYNENLGDLGSKLSGGQRQRIGFARMLYRNPEILALDEATSSLDVETEKNIMQNLISLREDRSIILITHRVSVLHSCDYIILMEQGEIIDSGSFSDLEERSSAFRQLLNLPAPIQQSEPEPVLGV